MISEPPDRQSGVQPYSFETPEYTPHLCATLLRWTAHISAKFLDSELDFASIFTHMIEFCHSCSARRGNGWVECLAEFLRVYGSVFVFGIFSGPVNWSTDLPARVLNTDLLSADLDMSLVCFTKDSLVDPRCNPVEDLDFFDN